MVTKLLLDIEKIKNVRNKSIMIPADIESIKVLKKWISDCIEKNLWICEYEEFLQKANGLDFNGLVIYNANIDDENNGIIEVNIIWRENDWKRNYLFLAD